MSSNTNPTPGGDISSHFVGRTREQLGDGWNDLWQTDRTYWDRGIPSPVLTDIVESKASYLPTAKKEGRRPRALVPGCGRGYDPVMLALHGYDAYGLDIAETAVQKGQEYAAAQFASPDATNFGDQALATADADQGTVKFISADFFKRDWEATTAASDGTKTFDLIYDYTFLCALPPDLRADWAQRMKELLSPDGILVALEFPITKSRDLPGPPWGLRGVHWNLLGAGGNGLLKEADEEADGKDADKGSFKRIVYKKPERTYERSQGMDMVSIWVLKN